MIFQVRIMLARESGDPGSGPALPRARCVPLGGRSRDFSEPPFVECVGDGAGQGQPRWIASTARAGMAGRNSVREDGEARWAPRETARPLIGDIGPRRGGSGRGRGAAAGVRPRNALFISRRCLPDRRTELSQTRALVEARFVSLLRKWQ